MSTFQPAGASSLANFNDTLSTISMIQIFIYISCSRRDKNQRLSMASQLTLFGESTVNTRRTYTKESKLSVVAVPRCGSKINFSPSSFIASKLQRYNIDDLYKSTLLPCTCATKKASRFWGVVNFCLYY